MKTAKTRRVMLKDEFEWDSNDALKLSFFASTLLPDVVNSISKSASRISKIISELSPCKDNVTSALKPVKT